MSIFDEEEDEEESEAQETEVVDVEGEVVEDNDAEMGVVKPVTKDLDQVKQAYADFEEVKTSLLSKEDLQSISGNTFITKSGWRKIATAFGVTTEVVREAREQPGLVVTHKVTAQATAPNGQSASAVGSCSSNESNFTDKLGEDKENKPDTPLDGEVAWVEGAWRRIKPVHEVKEHDIYATAATRAKNRAISDLVGGGNVSAEEMSADKFI